MLMAVAALEDSADAWWLESAGRPVLDLETWPCGQGLTGAYAESLMRCIRWSRASPPSFSLDQAITMTDLTGAACPSVGREQLTGYQEIALRRDC
jgi:hypothetical protein